jgi:16S rRNA uridine-516 pseudouridylate synthase and related pseudouridylate synthases
MRIAKYISNSGQCSRREAEKLIIDKKIKINNKICLHPSEKVKDNDVVKINNKIIKLEKIIRLWKIYKPIKYICSNKDRNNRKLIFNLIPKNFPRLISIGRLDFMSEGLLLLNNNGDFARKLEIPKSKYERIYRGCLRRSISKKDIDKIIKV